MNAKYDRRAVMYCEKCGCFIPENSLFCVRCGNRMINEQNNGNNVSFKNYESSLLMSPNKKRKKDESVKDLITVLVVFILIFVIGYGCDFINNKIKEDFYNKRKIVFGNWESEEGYTIEIVENPIEEDDYINIINYEEFINHFSISIDEVDYYTFCLSGIEQNCF